MKLKAGAMKKFFKWDITSNCNLSCRHCLTGDKYARKKTKDLSLDEKFKVIDKLAAGGVGSINLLGGEPMTLGEEFFSVIKYGVNKGIRMSSNTNGLFLEGEKIRKTVESGISELIVSIEGPAPESHDAIRGPGTYNRVIKNVTALAEHISKNRADTKITVNTVLNKQNHLVIEKMVDLSLDLGVNQWNLLQLQDAGRAKSNISDLSLTVKERIDVARRIAERVDPDTNDLGELVFEPRFTYPLVRDYIAREYGTVMPLPMVCCDGSLSLGYLEPDGEMFACDRAAGEFYGSQLAASKIAAANLLTSDFYEIWNSDYFLDMFKLITNGDSYKNYEPCNRCKYRRAGVCTPCPLYSLGNEKILIRECLWVEKKLRGISCLEDQDQLESTPRAQFKDNNQSQPEIINKYPVKVPGIRTNKVDGRLALFNPYTTEFFELNLMGAQMWTLIDGRRSMRDVINEAEKHLPAAVSGEAVFFTALREKGLIKLSDKPLQPRPGITP